MYSSKAFGRLIVVGLALTLAALLSGVVKAEETASCMSFDIPLGATAYEAESAFIRSTKGQGWELSDVGPQDEDGWAHLEFINSSGVEHGIAILATLNFKDGRLDFVQGFWVVDTKDEKATRVLGTLVALLIGNEEPMCGAYVQRLRPGKTPAFLALRKNGTGVLYEFQRDGSSLTVTMTYADPAILKTMAAEIGT